MIIILCPRAIASGGPELLHQLGCKLNLLGFEARISYYGPVDGRPPTHPYFEKYRVPVLDSLSDDPGNIFIYPEMLVPHLKGIMDNHPKGVHVLWWLSVDNAEATPELEDFLRSKKELIHMAQSYYALDYVKNVLRVPDDRLFYLSDYINNNYLNINTDTKRENIVLFNPRKGFERTSKLMCSLDLAIRWQALGGVSPDQVPGILQGAKVYIDFGNHPGKDRFPREAVACGCRIITGRRGAAANDKDVPLDDRLKIPDDSDDKVILDTIHWLFDDFEGSASYFDSYNRMIHEEFHVFESDVLSVFAKITNTSVTESGYDEDTLRGLILEAVSGEDYPKAFYYITIYRTNSYTVDEDLLILEGYVRLGIGEEAVALYLMNDLLKDNTENYEAHLIKARALSILEPGSVKASLDDAIKYSSGTEDEDYIRETAAIISSI